MDVYRQRPVPVIYTQLPFVRPVRKVVADEPEYIEQLDLLRTVGCGANCVSELEQADQLMVKCVIPDSILDARGTTGQFIGWQYYYWKLYDVQYWEHVEFFVRHTTAEEERLIWDIGPAEELLIRRVGPGGAVPLEKAGIRASFLETMADDSSCIPLLRKVEAVLGPKGYSLSKDMERSILEIERPLIARLQLQKMKSRRSATTVAKSTCGRTRSVPPRLRERIMRRDHYRCIFCGQGPQERELEVNHIIPKSLIRKLDLDERLYSAEENLCTTCRECNRSKSDNLARGDIEFYVDRFSSQSHPNHDIVRYLEAVRNLQSFEPNS